MFLDMVDRFKEESLSLLLRIRPMREVEIERLEEERRRKQERLKLSHGEEETQKPQTYRRQGKKVGRNDPCPCGSGKKYKKCCGRK